MGRGGEGNENILKSLKEKLKLGGRTMSKIKQFFVKITCEAIKVSIVLIVLLFFSLIIADKVLAISVTNPSPNPFNPGQGQKSTISFSVDSTQYVTVKIVNQYTTTPANSNNGGISHDYPYTSVWGYDDKVTYYEEVVKAQVARIYAVAGQTYSVSWDGTSDKGGTYNLIQRGTYYFKVIPENSPRYTVYKPVSITQWNPDWLAYIRQARTWIGTTPYNAIGANTVSRDNGRGINCTGFVATVFREMGYPYTGERITIYIMEISLLTE